jgi:hypothetical protein
MTIPATIKNGAMHPNRILLDAYIAKHGDGDYEIIITKRGDSKTLRQLRYVHGPVVGAISEHLGYSTKDIKAYLKREFGVKVERIDPMTAEIYEEPKSFADYTKEEMRLFLDEVILFCASINIHIPIPEDAK